MTLSDNIHIILQENNLVDWFLNNDPPESYAFWDAPEMDLIYNIMMTRNENNNITATEFSVACVDLKRSLKSSAEAN